MYNQIVNAYHFSNNDETIKKVNDLISKFEQAGLMTELEELSSIISENSAAMESFYSSENA